MNDKYDSNGSYPDNFKRKSGQDKIDLTDGENDESNPAAQKAGEYVRELLAEKILIDENKHPNIIRLIDQGICLFKSLTSNSRVLKFFQI